MDLNIYLFHRISPEANPQWPPVTPEHFERIVAHLSKNYHVVQLEDYLLNPGEQRVRKPQASIVFDDGYKDILTYAAPVLSKYNMPYSVYVVTDCADTGLPTWTYQLDWLFATTKMLEVPTKPELSTDEFQVRKWNSDLDRISYGQSLKAYLKNAPNGEQVRLIKHFKTTFYDVELDGGLMLNWEELRQLPSENCQIGSHTRSHPILTNLENEKLIEAELAYSRDRIKAELGQYPSTISYPNGNFNNSIVKIAKKIGYKIGLTVEQRRYLSKADDVMNIPRIQLYEESMVKTILRMNGTVEKVKKIFIK